MKTLIKNIVLATVLLTASLSFTGCQTAAISQASIARIQTAAKLAAYVGTTEYLRVHPEQRAGFVLARDLLGQIETSPTVDLPTLLAVVNKLPVKELKTERAQLIVSSATLLLSDYAGQLPLEKLNELKPVAASIREGIELALQ